MKAPNSLTKQLQRALLAVAIGTAVLSSSASENAPHRPFAQWADLPEKGQFIAGLLYQESEAYYLWAGNRMANVTWRAADGERYGIDINQAVVTFQYGITKHWAADLSGGFTGMGYRYFSNGEVTSSSGFMDVSLGVRYQLWNETNACCPWLPTTTFRAAAVLPGRYDHDVAFSPGYHSAAIAPELLLRKHFGWTGFGAYSDFIFRWNKTSANDHYIASVGLFQQFKGWELDVGYRHLQAVSGEDIQFTDGVPNSLVYPRSVREINDAIEAGFSYTTSKRKWRYAFQTQITIDGNNTDKKFWVGGSIDIPFSDRFLQPTP